jgi:site-specific DNA-cytosine methylase
VITECARHKEAQLGSSTGRPHTANNGADDDASKRMRYALLGNAVSVCVARWLGAQLMEPYK